MFLSKRTTASTRDYFDKIRELKNMIDDADAVVVGAGSGLSVAAGFVLKDGLQIILQTL